MVPSGVRSACVVDPTFAFVAAICTAYYYYHYYTDDDIIF